MKENKEIISFLKDKGFVFACSDIYGGLANSWDYGPLGAMFKSNIKELWKKIFIDQQPNIFHLDSSIILNSKVWKASGHIEKFSDPMVDCKECKNRFRADYLIEEQTDINPDGKTFKELSKIIKNIICPKCGKNNWTDVRNFELMFRTSNSKTGEQDDNLYLRPETAQGIFVNFLNVVNTFNAKVPFGIGQVGKAFRNEITLENFIFRTKEFEQLELEFFTTPDETQEWFDFYLVKIKKFLKLIGLTTKYFREFEVPKNKLAHYSSRTVDVEYKFPFGWGELLGLANRTDFDLLTHTKNSNESLEYRDPITNKKYIPHIIETSFGVERLMYAIIANTLQTEKLENGERDILKLSFELAPYKVAVAPLTNKLDNEATKLFNHLLTENIGPIIFTRNGSIGKRYRKQDEIGTPFVITYDFNSVEDESITVRHRDSMLQDRIKIIDIKKYILKYAK